MWQVGVLAVLLASPIHPDKAPHDATFRRHADFLAATELFLSPEISPFRNHIAKGRPASQMGSPDPILPGMSGIAKPDKPPDAP